MPGPQHRAGTEPGRIPALLSQAGAQVPQGRDGLAGAVTRCTAATRGPSTGSCYAGRVQRQPVLREYTPGIHTVLRRKH